MSRYIRNETVKRYMDLGGSEPPLRVDFYPDGKIVLGEKIVLSMEALQEMLDDYEEWADDQETANGLLAEVRLLLEKDAQ